MKFTKSQKSYSAVLGVGLCALLYDRCCSDTKASPKLAPVNASAVTAQHPGPVLISTGTDPFSDAAVADSLRLLQATLPASPEVRDAFVPSAAWIASSMKEHEVPSERAVKFQGGHRLRAILNMSSQGKAIVDDTLVMVGQSMDGFKLISVDEMKATFVDGQIRAILTLEPEEASRQAQP